MIFNFLTFQTTQRCSPDQSGEYSPPSEIFKWSCHSRPCCARYFKGAECESFHSWKYLWGRCMKSLCKSLTYVLCLKGTMAWIATQKMVGTDELYIFLIHSLISTFYRVSLPLMSWIMFAWWHDKVPLFLHRPGELWNLAFSLYRMNLSYSKDGPRRRHD